MSDLHEIIAHNAHRSYDQGATRERERIIKMLNSFFELTQEPSEQKHEEPNPEWDAGFQAAIALIRTNLPTKTVQKVVPEATE